MLDLSVPNWFQFYPRIHFKCEVTAVVGDHRVSVSEDKANVLVAKGADFTAPGSNRIGVTLPNTGKARLVWSWSQGVQSQDSNYVTWNLAMGPGSHYPQINSPSKTTNPYYGAGMFWSDSVGETSTSWTFFIVSNGAIYLDPKGGTSEILEIWGDVI